jgi:hypothetical protein
MSALSINACNGTLEKILFFIPQTSCEILKRTHLHSGLYKLLNCYKNFNRRQKAEVGNPK